VSLDFKVDELKEITYAAVTLKLKKYGKASDDNEVSGIFIGMQPLVPNNTALVSKDEIYIWLRDGKDCHMLSTKYYEVCDIFVGQGESAWKVVGKPSDLDKDSSRLVIIHLAMKSANRVGPNGLIDASTYKELPDHVQKVIGNVGSAFTGPSTVGTSTRHSRSSGTVHNSAACAYGSQGNHTPTTYKKKEVTTSIFKRTTRYSPVEAIGKMWAKILEIQEGTYKAPKLKAFKEKKEEKKASSTIEDSDVFVPGDWYGSGGVGY
jgi:hypothetical protein